MANKEAVTRLISYLLSDNKNVKAFNENPEEVLKKLKIKTDAVTLSEVRAAIKNVIDEGPEPPVRDPDHIEDVFIKPGKQEVSLAGNIFNNASHTEKITFPECEHIEVPANGGNRVLPNAVHEESITFPECFHIEVPANGRFTIGRNTSIKHGVFNDGSTPTHINFPECEHIEVPAPSSNNRLSAGGVRLPSGASRLPIKKEIKVSAVKRVDAASDSIIDLIETVYNEQINK